MSTGLRDFCREIYLAAGRNGLLLECTWRPSSGCFSESAMVALSASDQSVLNQLTLSTETTMTYPAGELPGLKPGEVVAINEQHYQVREVLAVADGSEMKAKLSRIKKEM